MNIKNLLIGGIAGAIVFFLLGWLIYGILLMDFMTAHPGAAGNIGKAEPDFKYLIIGNIAMGFLIAYVLLRAGVKSFGNGFLTGAIMGLLFAVSVDCTVYATSTAISKTVMAADAAASTAMWAITGGIIGVLIGLFTKKSV